jgi:hypothetical protein
LTRKRFSWSTHPDTAYKQTGQKRRRGDDSTARTGPQYQQKSGHEDYQFANWIRPKWSQRIDRTKPGAASLAPGYLHAAPTNRNVGPHFDREDGLRLPRE